MKKYTQENSRYMTLGWDADPFSVQFPELDEKTTSLFDDFNKSLILLSVHGIISQTERDKARKRILKLLEAALKKAKGKHL